MPASARLVGVDLARAVALLGMMSVHVLPELDAAEAVTPAYLIFAGRAAALFALLAGTGLALMTGGARHGCGRPAPSRRRCSRGPLTWRWWGCCSASSHRRWR